MWFLILLAVVAAVAVAYKYRVPLMAKVLGQPEDRIQRAIERRKSGRD